MYRNWYRGYSQYSLKNTIKINLIEAYPDKIK